MAEKKGNVKGSRLRSQKSIDNEIPEIETILSPEESPILLCERKKNVSDIIWTHAVTVRMLS